VNPPGTVEVVIGGRKFYIKSDKNPEYVLELAEKIQNLISKIKSGNSRITLDKALVLACFYLLDENETLKNQIKELGEEIKRLEEGAKIFASKREP
jgi:cell division protein ZapA